jgi:hypothetical protein
VLENEIIQWWSRVRLIDLRWFRESGRFVRNKGDDGIAEILLSKL